MEQNKRSEEPEQLERSGADYLEMLGLGRLINQQFKITRSDGKVQIIRGDSFLDVCGSYAKPALVALEVLGETNDERYPTLLKTVKDHVQEILINNIVSSPDVN